MRLIRKTLFGRHLDEIAGGGVKRLGPAVPDVRIGVAQHVLSGLNDLEGLARRQLQGWNSFDLRPAARWR
jgi:hypothetical protein